MRKGKLVKDILVAVSLAGVVVVSLAMPNLLIALKPFMKKNKYLNRQLKRSLLTLEKNRLVSIGEKNGKTMIVITQEGKNKILEYRLDDMRIKPQKRWDNKWRVVIFDIPENKRLSRLVLKDKLRAMGFTLLQKSVWVCPYPCEDEIEFLKEVYEIRPYVRILTAEKIDSPAHLLKIFHLG